MLAKRSPVLKVRRWVQSILDAAGLRKKQDGNANDYDEVKPSGGDGGVVIPPHFFEDGRSCLVRLDAKGNTITLHPSEAQGVLDGFQQEPGVHEQIAAMPDEPAQQAGTPKRGRPRKYKVERLDAGVLATLGLRTLTAEELVEDLDRLRFAVERDKKLQQWARGGSAEERGGRSEQCFGLIQALLRLDIHPSTIERFIRPWPRYSRESSSATEVLGVSQEAGLRDLLPRTSPWRLSIKPTGDVYRNSQTTDQGTLRTLLRACTDQFHRRLEGTGAANDDAERERLVVIDAAPGSGKTTVAIPEMLLRLRYEVTDCTWPLATLFRERRENVVESEDWLNMLTEEDLKSA